MTKPRLTAADVAAWVLKSRTAPAHLAPHWAPGDPVVLTRCLRRSYRVELMQPGQRCLLWVSGREQPGVHAIGTLRSAAEPHLADPGGRTAEVTVRLIRLATPVRRGSLLPDPAFADAEVLRMPAGSNPSFLTWEASDVLAPLLNPVEQEAAGWRAGSTRRK